MFTWEKIGKIFDPRDISDRSWLQEFAQAPATLIFDDFVRVYFSCRPPADAHGQYVSHSAYVDLDRKDLTRIVGVAEQPVLPLGNRGEFDEFGTYPFSAIRSGTTVTGYYAGWTRCESVPFNVAIGMAISEDDGLTFNKAGRGPVIPYSADEPFVMSGPKIRRFDDLWYLYYIAGKKWIVSNGRPEPVYRIRMATSQDGINWHKQNRDLIPPRIEENEAQASPDVTHGNDKYHMFFCYRGSENYRGRDNGYRIGYASSENLTEWRRDDQKAGINISDNGWDSEMISYPHILKLDGQVYMFYLGNQVGREGFGLARLTNGQDEFYP
ncbi:MAG: hypothetical protein ACK4SX_05655 [Alcanivoracaceae bacterium]